jgi:hypothetical protein
MSQNFLTAKFLDLSIVKKPMVEKAGEEVKKKLRKFLFFIFSFDFFDLAVNFLCWESRCRARDCSGKPTGFA